MLTQRILFVNKIIQFRAKLYKAENLLIIYIRIKKNQKINLYSRKVSRIDLFNYNYD